MLIGPDRPVLLPPRTSKPGPVVVSPTVETRAELMVKSPPYWWMISSPELGAVRVPPVIVPPVAFGVTRMPPDWSVFVPLRVNVGLPVLKRREFVVTPTRVAGMVTSVLVFEL